MMTAKFLCFLVILAVFLMSEAMLVRRQDPADPQSTAYRYQSTNPQKIRKQLVDDLGSRRIIEFWMISKTLNPMTNKLLDLLPKIPSKVIHPGTNIRMADIRLINITVFDGKFKVLRVGNITRTPPVSESFSLFFIAPTLMAVFKSDHCQEQRESRLPCLLVYYYENIEVNLRTYWSLKTPRRILHASILNAEPGSIITKLQLGNQAPTFMNHQKGSPSWNIMVNDAKSLIPDISQFDDLVKTFAENIFS